MLGGAFNNLTTSNPNQTTTPDNTAATNTPGFQLTDCGMFNKHFKVVGRQTRVIQPGEATTFYAGSRKPMVINEECYFSASDAGAGTAYALKFFAWKGWSYTIWKMESIPVSAAAGGTASVTMGDAFLNIIKTYRYKTSFVSQDTYKAFAFSVLPAATTEKLIFPGTSTANTQAPAI